MKTFTLKKSEIQKDWYVIDAQNLVLGRMASHIAKVLRGKNKPTYSPNLDCGDHIIVINADKVVLTGNKYADKTYYWHTGYPGGIKQRTAKQILEGRFPERVVEKAVQRMLPKGPLARQQLKNLHVYVGTEHPHTAQQPKAVDFAAMNTKNSRES